MCKIMLMLVVMFLMPLHVQAVEQQVTRELNLAIIQVMNLVAGRMDCYINDRIAIKMAMKTFGIDNVKAV